MESSFVQISLIPAKQNENPICQDLKNENPICQDLKNENPICQKDESRKRHNERRLQKRQGIYNLTSWHASRLRKMQDEDDYLPFITYIKWKGGNPPKEEDFQEEFEFLFELLNSFRFHNGYEFFEEHNLDFPPIGCSMEESYF